MYKMIAMDLDGTLLNDEKRIPDENIILINELITKGYEIVIATGRRYWSAKQLTSIIDDPLIILANNGNVVRNTENDEILIKKYMDLNDFKLVIKEGKERNLHPIVHVDNYDEGYDIIIEMDSSDNHYYEYLSQSEERYRKIGSYLDIQDNNILAVVYAGNKKDMEGFHIEINKRYPRRYSSHVMENINMAEALLEVMNPDGCKWLSLVDYARLKGIDESQIITIGDDNNDRQMIKHAGCGIAMKNGSKGVKQVADIITEKDNNESGVAFELKKILEM